jgi:putative heme iron utilization protein
MSEIKLQENYDHFCDNLQSVMLATSDEHGVPYISYSPFYRDENKHIYILISDIVKHTQNIRKRCQVSVMFIEDEASTKQIYARSRLTYECKTEELPIPSPEWDQICKKLEERFGNLIQTLVDLSDFHIFKLVPYSGRFVIGFGKAYEIKGDNLNKLEHLSGNPHGQSRKNEPLNVARERIISHMNEEHQDAVLMYAQVFGQCPHADSAVLKDLGSEGMDIEVTEQGQVESIHVSFAQPLKTATDAHMTLVDMAKNAKKLLQ